MPGKLLSCLSLKSIYSTPESDLDLLPPWRMSRQLVTPHHAQGSDMQLMQKVGLNSKKTRFIELLIAYSCQLNDRDFSHVQIELVLGPTRAYTRNSQRSLTCRDI